MILPRVLIVDDQIMFADGLALLLHERFNVVGAIGDDRLAVSAATRLRPDLILLAMSTGGVRGLEVIQHLNETRPEVPVIVLTMHGEAHLAVNALKAGAAGFLLKESSIAELLTAIDAVLQGRTYLTPTLTGEVLAILSAPNESPGIKLTPRHREVLRLIVLGQRVKEIAVALELSPRSIESIKYQMMQEMKVHSIAGLVRYALKHQLVAM